MEYEDKENIDLNKMDKFDKKFFDFLYADELNKKIISKKDIDEVKELLEISKISNKLTNPIVELFVKLKNIKEIYGATPTDLKLDENEVKLMAIKHKNIDEHNVSIGGRVFSALQIASTANERVKDYLDNHIKDAPSGFDLQEQIKKK
jgi:lysine 2,3-aminomutase